MSLHRLFVHSLFAVVLAACLAVAACGGDGELGPPAPAGQLSYVNAVPDTGTLDFRVVDIIGDAPTFTEIPFRGLSPFQAVQAGTRRLRVWVTPSRTDETVGSPMVWETTFDFQANQSYAFVLHGFARTGQTPPLGATMIPVGTLPTLAADQFAIRVVNLAPSFAGAIPTLADETVRPDVFVRRIGALPGGTPEAVDLGYLGVSPYVVLDTGRYRLALTATGTTGPVIVQGPVLPGVLGTLSLNPLAGSRVAGSVLTAVILPRSVPVSSAPQGTELPARTVRSVEVGGVTRSNDTVTVQSGSVTILTNRSPPAADQTVTMTGTGSSAAVGAGDVVFISGATEPEYNGWQVVMDSVPGGLPVADSLSCNPVNAMDTPTRCAATNVNATRRFRFRYRITGTPATPATGTPVYRIYPPVFTSDFTIPYVTYVVDRRPALTVP